MTRSTNRSTAEAAIPLQLSAWHPRSPHSSLVMGLENVLYGYQGRASGTPSAAPGRTASCQGRVGPLLCIAGLFGAPECAVTFRARTR